MNIYIDALKYAEENGINMAVSYNDTVNHLEKKGYFFEGDFEEYFLLWFFENFYEKYANSTIKNGTTQQVNNLISHLRNYQEHKFTMTAKGYSTLQEFYKLEQARRDAKWANRVAISALVITLLVGIIQILLQISCN
jgi:hypothetical protein